VNIIIVGYNFHFLTNEIGLGLGCCEDRRGKRHGQIQTEEYTRQEKKETKRSDEKKRRGEKS
jgi:hypothetical protein